MVSLQIDVQARWTVDWQAHLILGHYGFPEREWDSVSEEAKDLIRKLLVKEAPQRLSAEALLSHPWIQMADNAESDPVKMENRRRTLRTSGNIRRYVCVFV